MPRKAEEKKAPVRRRATTVARAPVRRAAAPRAPRPYVPRAPRDSGMFSSVGSGIGSAAGGLLGGPAGSALGSVLGKLGGGLVSKIMGGGDYQVTNAGAIKENSLLSNASNIPQFGTGKVVVNIKHREYIGDVISSSTAGAFQITSYPVNPGLASSFPWLSTVVGGNFQQHRIKGMTYEFRSMSSDALNSVNTALGQVIMASDYDSADSPFTTKQQMENTEYGVSCKPSMSMLHGIECARSQTSVSELFVRSYAVPAGADVRLYDLARFYIATNGVQGTSVNLGELWVTYDIDFFKAIQLAPQYQNPMVHLGLAGTSAATPLLPDLTVHTVQPAFDSVGIVSKSNTTIVLPSSIPVNSNWVLLLAYRGASTASVVSPSITYSNGLVTGWYGANGFLNGSSGGYSAPQTTTGTTICNISSFTYSGGGTPGAPPTITFGTAGTLPGTTQGGDLVLVMINGNAI